MINRQLKIFEIDVDVSSSQWKSHKSLLNKGKLKKIICFTLQKLKACAGAKVIEVSIKLSDNHEIQIYNARYRNIHKPTNVLSFPTLQKASADQIHLHLGDIIFAFETIQIEASQQNKSFSDHFIHLFVHSLLHLLGYTHDKKKDRNFMESLEIEILEHFDIKSPYA